MHQQELHRSKFKSGIRCCEESLQELAEDLERLVRLAYPLVPKEMKDLLVKEQFTDEILDGDARSLKQSWPQVPLGCSDASYGAGIVPTS